MSMVVESETGFSLLDESLSLDTASASIGSVSGYSGLFTSDFSVSPLSYTSSSPSSSSSSDSSAWADTLGEVFKAAGQIVPVIAGAPQKQARAAAAIAAAEQARLAQAQLFGGGYFPGTQQGFSGSSPAQRGYFGGAQSPAQEGIGTATMLLFAGGAAVGLWLLLRPKSERGA